MVTMHYLLHWARTLSANRRGQDLIEYALATGFVAVAASAFFPPAIAPAITQIFTRINDLMGQATGS